RRLEHRQIGRVVDLRDLCIPDDYAHGRQGLARTRTLATEFRPGRPRRPRRPGRSRILAAMPELIAGPSRVDAAGEPPKLIEEFVGRASTGAAGRGIPRMRSPAGGA